MWDLEKDCINAFSEVELYEPKTGRPKFKESELGKAMDLCIEFIEGEYDFNQKEKYINNVKKQRTLFDLQYYMVNSIFAGLEAKKKDNMRQIAKANA